MSIQLLNNKKGFTLIEVMVATSIFMIIMLMAMGSLIVASDSAKKAQAIRSAFDNVSFAMESMTRSLRMGTSYECIQTSLFSLPAPTVPPDPPATPTPQDCQLVGSSGGNGIAFLPAPDASNNYRPEATAYITYDRGDNTTSLRRCVSSSPCIDMVSNEVNIKSLKFFVTGSNSTDNVQPSVYILMKGVVTVKGEPTAFALQTIASQRTSE